METIQRNFCATIERSSETPVLPLDPTMLRTILESERCVVFSGFDASIEDFENITVALSDDFHAYRGGGFTVGRLSRSTVNNNSTLMTATGSTQDFPLPLHGEMYYLSQPPDLIWFYCQVPVAEGGQTTIGDARQIFRDLSTRTQELLRERKIRYERRMDDGDWQITFQTESRAEVEEFCKSQGLEIIWTEDGTAITYFYTSALREDAANESAFINSLLIVALGEQAMRSAKDIKLNFIVRWEDGSPIAQEILDEINRVCARNEIEVSWQRGDIILVDNRSVMHGRRGSNDKDRKILVRMGTLSAANAPTA